jgi:hypothetical protein
MTRKTGQLQLVTVGCKLLYVIDMHMLMGGKARPPSRHTDCRLLKATIISSHCLVLANNRKPSFVTRITTCLQSTAHAQQAAGAVFSLQLDYLQ